ncbi:hypothetical protein QEG73_21835 [Chitinophagaceae bacterium 26-R-25]|nr:hypothetical protein [Chitinophagaceae bacterium 26-R-25]
MTKQKPAKPETETDIALRNFINHLIENGQILVFSAFTEQLGYKTPHQVDRFLKGQVNYPRPRLESTVEILRDQYGANYEFLMSNKGPMFAKSGSQGVRVVGAPRFGVGRKLTELEKLKKAMEELRKMNEDLEQRLRDKDELISVQNKLIKRIEEQMK